MPLRPLRGPRHGTNRPLSLLRNRRASGSGSSSKAPSPVTRLSGTLVRTAEALAESGSPEESQLAFDPAMCRPSGPSRFRQQRFPIGSHPSKSVLRRPLGCSDGVLLSMNFLNTGPLTSGIPSYGRSSFGLLEQVTNNTPRKHSIDYLFRTESKGHPVAHAVATEGQESIDAAYILRSRRPLWESV